MADRQRLFFALWPAEKLQRQWAEMARARLGDLDGRLVPHRNLHLTLAFLGDVDEARRRCVEAAADGIEAATFSITLAQLGYWRRSRVIWLGPRQTPPALQSLVGQLQESLKSCGFQGAGRDYRPHMTLMRKARRRPPRVVFEPLAWRVDRFVLARSRLSSAGAEYEILKVWSLSKGARPLKH